jgi:hypothetical protein
MTFQSQQRAKICFDWGAWLTLAAVIGFVLAVLATTVYVLAMPGDGWQMPYDTTPQPWPLENFIGDWPTALRSDDRVVAVDGTTVARDDQLAPLKPPLAWRDGGTVVYTILRDGDSVDVNVTLRKLGPLGILRGLWHAMQDTPAEWSWSLVAIAVFLLRPRDRAAHLLLLIGVSHSAVTKLGWASITISSNFAPPVVYYTQLLTGWFWGTLFWPSIILLALSFPLRIFPLTRWPRAVPALLYGLPLALTFLMLVTNQIMLATLVLVSEGVLMFVAFGAAFFNALKRSRDAVARAQALWVIFGFVISIGLVLPVYLLAYVGVVDPNSFEWAYNLLSPLTALVLPVSLGIAITRYRLFDIDVIIRKTLVYSVLTLLLALVYFGSVVLIEQAFRSLTDEKTSVAIVLSTLVAAALFAPLRRKIQDVIDRRFYRRKYNAARALAAFAATARDEVDLRRLTTELARVVGETVQPTHLSIWLPQDAVEGKPVSDEP